MGKWVLLLLLLFPVLGIGQGKRPRVVVLTDIEADPDDTQSLIRFLTYCNQWDVEGAYSHHVIHQKTRVAPESILRVLDAYGKVQPNLLLHEKGYPTAVALKAKVRHGLAVYGMAGVGEGHDSPGSELIVDVLRRKDERPVWFVVWGGPNTLAQALWKIQKTLPAVAAEAIYKKVRIYTISDQDDSGAVDPEDLSTDLLCRYSRL